MSLLTLDQKSKRAAYIRIKGTYIFVLSTVWTMFAAGQELRNMQVQDTSRKSMQYDRSELFLVRPALTFPPSRKALPLSFSSFLHQSLSTPLPSMSWTFQQKFDLQTAWKQDLAKSEEYKTLRMILQSIEMGGVAYLTYLHLQKYGFP